MAALLEVKDLVKHYPKVKAVNGVSFEVAQGTCFGLLGPNGAGKTTTVEMMEGITRPTSGTILFRGKPVDGDFKQRSGIQFQKTGLQDYLKVREVLELFQSFYRKTRNLNELARLCDLTEFWDRDANKLSGGQRQRVLLAAALVGDPDVVFLDEPTTGLDPAARRNFWDLVKSVKAEGKTVLLTTHYMEEAYVLCDEIGIMNKGLLIARGEPDKLLKQHFSDVAIEIPLADFFLPLESLPFAAILNGDVVEIQTSDVNQTLRYLLDRNLPMARMRVRPQTLEDLFLALTGKEISP